MLDKPSHSDINSLKLTQEQISVLNDIRYYLFAFHSIQEIASSEKAPTLSVVIPAFEKVINILRLFSHRKPYLRHVVNASLKKLEEYLEKMRDNPVYLISICMCYIHCDAKFRTDDDHSITVLNPSMKLKWAQENWTPNECDRVLQVVRAEVNRMCLELLVLGALMMT